MTFLLALVTSLILVDVGRASGDVVSHSCARRSKAIPIRIISSLTTHDSCDMSYLAKWLGPLHL